MIKHSEKILAVLGILGVIALASSAKADTQDECEQLSGNMYLAAIERGDCDINIQTAAGPQEEPTSGEDGDQNRHRDGRNGGKSGGQSSNGRSGGSPNPNKP
ncbi:hypothetical protein [Dongia sp.]|uniref:hypothetical protein n=1 Tax=Dongia sp. TaxID=1977262 RepID=UPI00375066CD